MSVLGRSGGSSWRSIQRLYRSGLRPRWRRTLSGTAAMPCLDPPPLRSRTDGPPTGCSTNEDRSDDAPISAEEEPGPSDPLSLELELDLELRPLPRPREDLRRAAADAHRVLRFRAGYGGVPRDRLVLREDVGRDGRGEDLPP